MRFRSSKEFVKKVDFKKNVRKKKEVKSI